jgi:SRSO17 transposase
MTRAIRRRAQPSVAVARQYCAQFGEQDGCPATDKCSRPPIEYKESLPKEWADHQMRRANAHAPKRFAFMTKTTLTLDQSCAARRAKPPTASVLANAHVCKVPTSGTFASWVLLTRSASRARPRSGTTAVSRWRIVLDYQLLKQELGLDYYEGRNWRSFHLHASRCIAIYDFLIRSRLRRGKTLPLCPCYRRPAQRRMTVTRRY